MSSKTVLTFSYKGVSCKVKHIKTLDKNNPYHIELTKEMPLLKNMLDGHYCGYIELDRKLKDEVIYSLDVHGGIIFDEFDFDIEKNVYWFDCAQYGDNIHDQNIDFVIKELESLVDQIID